MEVVDENAMQIEGLSPVSVLGPYSVHRRVVGEVLHSVLSNFSFHFSLEQRGNTQDSSQKSTVNSGA